MVARLDLARKDSQERLHHLVGAPAPGDIVPLGERPGPATQFVGRGWIVELADDCRREVTRRIGHEGHGLGRAHEGLRRQGG